MDAAEQTGLHIHKSITFRKHWIALNQIPVLSIKTCWSEAFSALFGSTRAPSSGAEMNCLSQATDSFSVLFTSSESIYSKKKWSEFIFWKEYWAS